MHLILIIYLIGLFVLWFLLALGKYVNEYSDYEYNPALYWGNSKPTPRMRFIAFISTFIWPISFICIVLIFIFSTTITFFTKVIKNLPD